MTKFGNFVAKKCNLLTINKLHFLKRCRTRIRTSTNWTKTSCAAITPYDSPPEWVCKYTFFSFCTNRLLFFLEKMDYPNIFLHSCICSTVICPFAVALSSDTAANENGLPKYTFAILVIFPISPMASATTFL